MKKSFILLNVVCGILSSCGGGVSKDPTALSSRTSGTGTIAKLSAAQIDEKMVGDTIKFKDKNVVLDSSMAEGFNAKGDSLKRVFYVNTKQSTDKRFIFESGSFNQDFLIQEGVSILKNVDIKGDFVNHGGAVRIDTDYETKIEGKFESTGQTSLTPHRHPTNGIRILNIGDKSLKVKSALFDGSEFKSDGSFITGGTEFNIVLTNKVSGDYKTKTAVIEASEDIAFSKDKTTIINFEKLNKAVIKAGSTHALAKAKKIEVDISKFRLDYRPSTTSISVVQEAENNSIEFLMENYGGYDYLVMKVLKDIAAVSSPYIEKRHFDHAHHLASCGMKKHHFGKQKFKSGTHKVALSDDSYVSVEDSGNGFGFSKGKASSLLQMHANFDETSKNAHIQQSVSLSGILFSGQSGFYLENDAKTNAGSFYASVGVAKTFSKNNITFLPKLSFDYMRDLNSLYALRDQDSASFVSASFATPGAWAFSSGVEISSSFSLKGMNIETSVNFEHAQNLDNRKVVIDGQGYDVSFAKTSVDFGLKAALDSYTNLYGTCGISSDQKGASGNLSFGVNVKL